MSAPVLTTAQSIALTADDVDPFDVTEFDADGMPTTLRALVRYPGKDMRLRLPVDKKTKSAQKNVIKTLKELHPEFSGISFKQIKQDEAKDELLTVEMRLSVKVRPYFPFLPLNL